MSDFKMNENPDSQMNRFVLYSTSACHLCEEAMSILSDLHEQMLSLAQNHNISLSGERVFVIDEFDIAADDELIESFGTRIPVLIFPKDKAELTWPFDIQQVYEFIAPRLIF
tara:strand:+ start:13518 stop:13853 length:336 start_codon:yes stop_codon:yes gene_type:complete